MFFIPNYELYNISKNNFHDRIPLKTLKVYFIIIIEQKNNSYQYFVNYITCFFFV